MKYQENGTRRYPDLEELKSSLRYNVKNLKMTVKEDTIRIENKERQRLRVQYLIKDKVKSIARFLLLIRSEIKGSWTQCQEDLIIDTYFKERHGRDKIKYMEIGANAQNG